MLVSNSQFLQTPGPNLAGLSSNHFQFSGVFPSVSSEKYICDANFSRNSEFSSLISLQIERKEIFVVSMEVVVYHPTPGHVPLKSAGKRSISHSIARKNQLLPSVANSSICCHHPRTSNSSYHPSLKNRHHQGFSTSHSRQTPHAFNDSYVLEGEDSVGDVRKNVEGSISKVLIPGLPDESNGDRGAPISSCFWEWKPKFNVHYEKAGCEKVGSPPVLFLPGFGVGSFHYEKQLKDLGRDSRVWALDFLGQGMSLPIEDPAPLFKGKGGEHEGKDEEAAWGFGDKTEPWADELVYSMDLWKDQVQYFVEQVIGEPVYLVGNSLGGYVALYFAACNPHLVKGVTLLNATPFWGFLPNPTKSPLLARLFPWAGTFPLPPNVRKVTEIVWQKISDPSSIADVLKQVYADHSTNVDKVFSRILDVTQHPAAAAAFVSIMCAPAGNLSFKESLSRCRENRIPICLMYGREDPWVKPIWGREVKRQVPDAPYYEISPAGHCPHDEVPEVVNFLLRGWIKNLESGGSVTLPLLDDAGDVEYELSKDLDFFREGSKKSVQVRFFGSKFSIWNQIISLLKARIAEVVAVKT